MNWSKMIEKFKGYSIQEKMSVLTIVGALLLFTIGTGLFVDKVRPTIEQQQEQQNDP